MVERLRRQYKDRFSHYFDAEQLADFNQSINGTFSGVGMTVGAIEEKGTPDRHGVQTVPGRPGRFRVR